MLDFQLAKSIHEDHLREAERKRLHRELLNTKAHKKEAHKKAPHKKANAAPAAGRRLLLTLGALLFLFRR